MMDICIYQINRNRDTNNVAFLDYDALPKFHDTQEPDPRIYDTVYEGA